MKRLIMILVATGLTMAIGCSDDEEDKKTVDTIIGDGGGGSVDSTIIGSLLDLQFLAFVGQYSQLNESDGDGIQAALNLAGQIMMPPTKSVAILSDPVFHESSQYWYQTDTVIAIDKADFLFESITEDSVQFWHGTQIVMTPNDAELTKVLAGISTSEKTESDTDSSLNVSSQNLVLTPLGIDTIGINGSGSFSTSFWNVTDVTRDTMTCGGGSDFTFTATDVVGELVNNQLECPHAGSAKFVGVFDNYCGGADPFDLSTNWTVNAVFEPTEQTITFGSGNTNWIVKDTCGDSGPR
ncbi:MAG: hypothetical protein P1R58_10255 [bacterium]|nr:hypothetical protein [bacterium]